MSCIKILTEEELLAVVQSQQMSPDWGDVLNNVLVLQEQRITQTESPTEEMILSPNEEAIIRSPKITESFTAGEKPEAPPVPEPEAVINFVAQKTERQLSRPEMNVACEAMKESMRTMPGEKVSQYAKDSSYQIKEIDYHKTDRFSNDSDIGEIGEIVAANYLSQIDPEAKLEAIGTITNGSGNGVDILAKNNSGKIVLIEVKCTDALSKSSKSLQTKLKGSATVVPPNPSPFEKKDPGDNKKSEVKLKTPQASDRWARQKAMQLMKGAAARQVIKEERDKVDFPGFKGDSKELAICKKMLTQERGIPSYAVDIKIGKLGEPLTRQGVGKMVVQYRAPGSSNWTPLKEHTVRTVIDPKALVDYRSDPGLQLDITQNIRANRAADGEGVVLNNDEQ